MRSNARRRSTLPHTRNSPPLSSSHLVWGFLLCIVLVWAVGVLVYIPTFIAQKEHPENAYSPPLEEKIGAAGGAAPGSAGGLAAGEGVARPIERPATARPVEKEQRIVPEPEETETDVVAVEAHEPVEAPLHVAAPEAQEEAKVEEKKAAEEEGDGGMGVVAGGGGQAGAEEVTGEPVGMQVIGEEWDWQWKFDEKLMLRLSKESHPPPLERKECAKEDDHKKLLDKVVVHAGDDPAAHPAGRVLCLTYTYHKNHDTAVKALRETWVHKCDGFISFSDVYDPGAPTFGIKHEGPEEYNNVWQKVRAIWKYVHRYYLEEYEWFTIGGDDIFFIMENLRAYLSSDEINAATEQGTKPIFLGRRFKPIGRDIFNSGGAGYVLNRPALTALATNLDDGRCMPHQKVFAEDVNVAKCLRLTSGVEPYDTRDSLGEERFHPFNPMTHRNYKIATDPKKRDWYYDYSIDLKVGMECCSTESLSFHYIKPDLQYRLYDLIYRCRESE